MDHRIIVGAKSARAALRFPLPPAATADDTAVRRSRAEVGKILDQLPIDAEDRTDGCFALRFAVLGLQRAECKRNQNVESGNVFYTREANLPGRHALAGRF